MIYDCPITIGRHVLQATDIIRGLWRITDNIVPSHVGGKLVPDLHDLLRMGLFEGEPFLLCKGVGRRDKVLSAAHGPTLRCLGWVN